MNLDLQFYRELKESLSAIIEQYASEVATGKASSYDDYKHRTGRIRGIMDALDLAETINQRMIGVEDKRDSL